MCLIPWAPRKRNQNLFRIICAYSFSTKDFKVSPVFPGVFIVSSCHELLGQRPKSLTNDLLGLAWLRWSSLIRVTKWKLLHFFLLRVSVPLMLPTMSFSNSILLQTYLRISIPSPFTRAWDRHEAERACSTSWLGYSCLLVDRICLQLFQTKTRNIISLLQSSSCHVISTIVFETFNETKT